MCDSAQSNSHQSSNDRLPESHKLNSFAKLRRMQKPVEGLPAKPLLGLYILPLYKGGIEKNRTSVLSFHGNIKFINQALMHKVKGEQKMSLASKLKTADFRALTPIGFYAVAGILLLALLPFVNFPPHIGLTGILSLITAYGLVKKRFWAFWLVIALFFVVTMFSLYTLYVIALGNLPTALSMIAYVILTWIFTAYVASKRNA